MFFVAFRTESGFLHKGVGIDDAVTLAAAVAATPAAHAAGGLVFFEAVPAVRGLAQVTPADAVSAELPVASLAIVAVI